MDIRGKYRNVTISGLPGAGSTTLGKALANVLGWEYFSGGDFLRAHAVKKGAFDPNNTIHHDATLYSEDLDRQVDYGMRDTIRTKQGNILESWISGFMAQGIAGVLKILLFCSDDAVRVDRIVNRDHLTVEEAKRHIFEREKKNVEKWRSVYQSEWQEWVVSRSIVPATKPIWFWYRELFDLAIDTYTHSREETLKQALTTLGATGKVDYEKVFAAI